jgi:hypothetical protein
MLFFNTWGIMNAFGVFQTYYESGALFTASSSNISWIGTVQSVLVSLSLDLERSQSVADEYRSHLSASSPAPSTTGATSGA